MISELIFYISAGLLLFFAVMVVLVRQPVHSVLCLVAAFLCSAVIWMLLQAEFLSLVLIFVYVGAVMTLFLFVVMMLNVDLVSIATSDLKSMSLSFLVLLVLAFSVLLMFHTLLSEHLGINTTFHSLPLSTSNTKQLGILLYGDYLFSFELAGVLLVLAIVASISLAYFGRKPGTKRQSMSEQHAVTKSSRLRVHQVVTTPAKKDAQPGDTTNAAE